MSKIVLITGVLGQDGSYMARHALCRGYRVVGGVRPPVTPERLWRLHHLGIADQVELRSFDLLEPDLIARTIDDVAPDLIFNFAAQSSVGESFQAPILTAEAGGMGALRIFEKAKTSPRRIKVFQASSSEIFGDITDTHHSEESFFNPKTPYGATKLFAHIMAEAYRASYGTHVSTGILFNHESPLRALNFVTRKITHTLARIKLGLEEELRLGNLDARRDWSHAIDFVDAMWRIMELDSADNFVLASGRLSSVRDFVTMAALSLDMELAWEGQGQSEVGYCRRTGVPRVRVDPSFYRPYDPAQPIANTQKIQRAIGWRPTITLEQLVEEMTSFDLSLLQGSDASTTLSPSL